MPRRCTVCDHPQRTEIDAALIAGQGFRAIARLFESDRSAIDRHSKSHLREKLVQAEQRRQDKQDAESETLLERLQAARRHTLEILGEARQANKLGVALDAIKRIQEQLTLEGRLLGEFERAEAAAGKPDFREILAEASERARASRDARLAKLAALTPKLRAMSLEELWKYEPEADPDDDHDDIGIGRLVALKRDLLAEIAALRGEKGPALPLASLNPAPGGRPELPPAPDALTPEVEAPGGVQYDRDGMPRPTMRMVRTVLKVEVE